MSHTGELTDRDREILSIVVQEYIERGEPISSLWLTRHANLHVKRLSMSARVSPLDDPAVAGGHVGDVGDVGRRSFTPE